MASLALLINTVLDQIYDDVDTNIAVNCHVLASTYYLMEDQI